METPTARVMKEDRFRVGAGQVHPYRYYYITGSPLKGLEIGGRVTEIIGVKALQSGYGNYKDKALDVKYQFLEEGKYGPALAFGMMDPQGTRIYSSQYIAASKQIYPFDFTLGFGNGRFGKRPIISQTEGFQAEIFTDTKTWLKDSQFFWGIQFAPSEKFALMMEYSPIRYEIQTQDPAQPKYFSQAPPSQFNYGLRLKPWSWTDITLSYQRGDTVGLNLSMAFDIGQPLIPVYDYPYRENLEDRTNSLHKRLAKALHASGFSNIGVDTQGNDLCIEAQNDTYFYSTKAIGVILKIVNDIAPPDIQQVKIVLTNNLIPVVQFSTTRSILQRFTGKNSLQMSFSFCRRLIRMSWILPTPVCYTEGFLITVSHQPSGCFLMTHQAISSIDWVSLCGEAIAPGKVVPLSRALRVSL